MGSWSGGTFFFLPWEAETILRILVCEGPVTDKLIWPLRPDEDFSVMSAY